MSVNRNSARNSAFLTLCAMGFIAILSSTMSKSPVLKPFSLSLNTPTDWTGIVAAASTVPGILVSFPAASLSDILGRKRFLLLAGFVFASAPFLYLFVTVWWHLILVRFYHGFATAIFVPVAEASVIDLFSAQRGERISLFSSATYVGRVIAPVLGGYVLFATASDFDVVYLAVGLAGVAAFVTAMALYVRDKGETIAHHDDSSPTFRRIFQGWREVAKAREVVSVSLVQSAHYFAYGATEFFLAGYLLEVAGLNPFLTGAVITSIIGVAIIGRPYMGRVSDRFGRRPPIVAGCILSSLPLFAVAFVTDFWVLLPLVMVYGLGLASVTASAPALVSELVPDKLAGTSMGFLDTMMDVGQTFGPITGGLILASSLQYVGVFSFLGIVLLGSGLLFVLSQTGRSNVRHD